MKIPMNKRRAKKVVRKLWRHLHKKPTVDVTRREALWLERKVDGWHRRLFS